MIDPLYQFYRLPVPLSNHRFPTGVSLFVMTDGRYTDRCPSWLSLSPVGTLGRVED